MSRAFVKDADEVEQLPDPSHPAGRCALLCKRMALMHKKALQAILNKKSPSAASNWRKALRGFILHLSGEAARPEQKR
jgi:hypothetical protein